MTTPTQNTQQVSLLSDGTYNLLKQFATLILPAVGVLYFALAQIWNLPAAEQVAGTIAALNAFAGVVVTFAKYIHQATNPGTVIDGTLTIVPGEDTDSLRLTSIDPKALETKDQIIFQVDRSASK